MNNGAKTSHYFPRLQPMLLLIFALLIAIILLGIILGFLRTWQVQNSPNQSIFLKGTAPNPMPDGLYKGDIGERKVSWVGKRFNAGTSSGINLFTDKNSKTTEKYPFKTSVGKGLVDKSIDVLKIDYNIPQNPFWLRIILDEIVQVSATADGGVPSEGEKEHYLGKVMVKIIPGYPFALGYFNLKK